MQGFFGVIEIMTEPPSPSELKSLDAKLRKARERKGKRAGRGKNAPESAKGLGLAFRLTVDLVAGIAVGVGIGLLLDKWLGWSPWGMIVFFFLGAAAGMMNMFRTISGGDMAVGYARPPEPPGKSEEEDDA